MKRVPPYTNSNRIYFMHLRYIKTDGSTDNKGGMTIAYREDGDKDELQVAIAKCHPNDNFCKSIGRAIAVGNLNWGRFWSVCKPDDEVPNNHRTAYEYVREKIRTLSTPQAKPTLH